MEKILYATENLNLRMLYTTGTSPFTTDFWRGTNLGYSLIAVERVECFYLFPPIPLAFVLMIDHIPPHGLYFGALLTSVTRLFYQQFIGFDLLAVM